MIHGFLLSPLLKNPSQGKQVPRFHPALKSFDTHCPQNQ